MKHTMETKKKVGLQGKRVEVEKSSAKNTSKKFKSAIIYSESNSSENQMTAFEKMKKLEQGLSKTHLESLKARTALDYNELSHILSVTRSTLINKKEQQNFSLAVGERMLDLAGIYSYGYKVFEDESKFREWMFKDNQALGGQAPYDILDNQFGREEVKNLIGRIEYGVYS